MSSYFLDQGALGAHLPLTALIDSRGHRLLATSVLPISSSTLVYGTENAGSSCDVIQTDAALRVIVNEVCTNIGLKKHFVIDGRDPLTRRECSNVEITSPIDLEGHKGNDGRYYLVDCSRLMPPAFKFNAEPFDRYWQFYAGLRPEFLSYYGKPLNPDALSPFSSISSAKNIEALQHEQEELKSATSYLMAAHLEFVARKILNYWVDGGREVVSFSLTKKMHRHGVNMRLIGFMLATMREKFAEKELEQGLELLKWFECEGMARAAKNCLRRVLRDAHRERAGSGSAHLVAKVVDFVNKFVGIIDRQTWEKANENVLQFLRLHFGFNERDLDHCVTTFLTQEMLRSNQGKCTARAFVLDLVCEMTGVTIFPAIMEGLRSGRLCFEGAIIRLTAPDVSFTTRIKRLNVVDHAAGFILYQQGLKALDIATKLSYFTRAHENLVKALKSSPFDTKGLALAGDINLHHMKLVESEIEKKQLSQRANDYFKAAISLDPLNLASRRSFAELKFLNNDVEGAEGLFLEILEIDDRDPLTLERYASFLKSQKNEVEAEKLFERFKKVKSF